MSILMFTQLGNKDQAPFYSCQHPEANLGHLHEWNLPQPLGHAVPLIKKAAKKDYLRRNPYMDVCLVFNNVQHML